MSKNINLDEIQPVNSKGCYCYNLRLMEFNGNCRIVYSTDSPLLCPGTINLVTTDGPTIVAYTAAQPTGGHFDTGKPWGSGWYAQWNAVDSNGAWVVMTSTPITGQ